MRLRDHSPFVLRIVEGHRVLVDPAMDGDLVLRALPDFLHHRGVHHRRHRGDVERDGNGVLVEQLQHPRHALERAVLAEGDRDGIVVAGIQRNRKVVGVDGNADRDARAVRPGLRRQLAAGPDMVGRLPDLLVRPLQTRLIGRAGLLGREQGDRGRRDQSSGEDSHAHGPFSSRRSIRLARGPADLPLESAPARLSPVGVQRRNTQENGMTETTRRPGLLERLADGPVICAEGYLFEFERRGYLQAGAFVPEVVLEHPDLVTQLHREFVHAGSDVVEAFTYYAHREKLRLLGKEQLLEAMNKQALSLAKSVAVENGALVAGDLSNTNIFMADDASRSAVRAMFEEQVGWAVDAGVDFIIGETFSWAEEASIALEEIKRAGVPAVITLAAHQLGHTRDGLSYEDACKRLEDDGADVVGLNCSRGPRTMLPLLEPIRRAVKGHVAALPVPYRTTDAEPTFQSLQDPSMDLPGGRPFPTALDPFLCNRYEIAAFGRSAYEIGVRYLGVCCGAGPHHIRSLAEALGRNPPASRYTADMSKHAYFGTDARVPKEYREYAPKL